MTGALLSVEVCSQRDVVAARQRARQIAALLGFGELEQTRIATAVSEVARNAFEYGRGGRTTYAVEAGADRRGELRVRVQDNGPGIPHLADVLAGRYRSPGGMGTGLVGARRLADRFEIDAPAGAGTRVTLAFALPRPVDSARLAALGAELARMPASDPLQEATRQNRELLAALDALQARQAEVERLNRELAETNRGVLALYAELDEKAEQLRRASEHKTRFLSAVSHELRTPLASVLNISWLLQQRVDGPLTDEQERQVGFVRQSAQSLVDIVNDLLDLAKVEAGRFELRPTEFTADELLGALRATLRPLVANPAVELVIEEAPEMPPLHTDEARISQVLRNLVSNALKFTERGEVRVMARANDDGTASFVVRDTGIGIRPEDQERVFEEFAQVEGPLQRTVTGTGLGLPLARGFAELLGGRLTLASAPGRGSEFVLTVPMVHASVTAPRESEAAT